ncbi:3'(2'),5'-bisphosphate nucleotidase CysQ [Sphingorhabdus sp.]|uniref:3'(2'),5'-bisphosphate nucleotidase CysQ n=1 Tax=Sphingorhabdus sp. TaxID=1902408 RepID=UPI0035ADDC37|nr:3'(2'),5'-bisphosphate nucleotidase CysQ [Sphingomonadaceae bacterium]
MPDREAAIQAVCEAGNLALSGWREGAAPDAAVWEKTRGHPVCDADLAVDALLKQRLGALAPNIGWLSEETADNPDRLSMSRQWLVDPIDGTRDYIRGRSGWCVSVALIEGSEAVFAAIYAPVTAQLWVAHKGEGTTCNGKRLTASQRVAFSGARVPTDALPKIDRDLQMVHKPNSIAMRMTMVACDRADLVATLRWGNEWDIAAAHLIAEEAGAVVTSATGQPILYNKREPMDFGLICCAAGIHDAAVERLRERVAAILA